MATSERTPRTQQQERPQTPDAASIASRVVAMLEVVSPLLPDLVQEQVNQLISIHDAAYQAALPSTEQQNQHHEQ